VKRPVIDGTTLAAVVAALALLGAYWAATSVASSYYRINTPQATSFSSAPQGMRAAFEYLDALGHEPVALTRFEELPQTGTIVVATDVPLTRGFTEAEVGRLAEWVESGGRLVAIGPYANEALAGLGGGSVLNAEGPAGPLGPILPTPYAPDAGTFTPGTARLTTDDAAWVPVYGDPAGAALMVRAVGAGEVVWLADRYPVSNDGIGEGDNGAFAVRLLAGETPVYFDEYHHGFVSADTVLGRMGAGGHSAIIVGALALVVLLLARGRRLGPAIAAEPVREARTLAYVDSLAGLYRTAGARTEALASLAGGLERSLAKRHGSVALGLRRRPEAADALAHARELGARAGLGEEEFVTAARRIARARREVERIDG
jgi:hypothetical protein